ncbi:hypothetical protein [Nocardia australiensis]|uniref:hypothetical protein n=1 Tax=Nocardia australiensis TaxID=2887191 RepID=UPI001D14C707|nr:hypothetical protein [Nocardia australiensis]
MGTGKHRAPNLQRRKVGSIVAAGAIPLVLALVGTGTAHAEPAPPSSVTNLEPEANPEANPNPEAGPNPEPNPPAAIPAEPHSSLQGLRPVPDTSYLAPLGALHAPEPVAPVAPIAPPPGQLRFGGVAVGAPDWIDPQQSVEINGPAAVTEASIATFLDSVGMERSRSDLIAGQTVAGAAIGAAAGAAVSSPLAATSAAVGAVAGFISGVPFLPIGLVIGPVLGAAIGTAVITVPASAVGAAAGAALGAIGGLAAPSYGSEAPLPPVQDQPTPDAPIAG